MAATFDVFLSHNSKDKKKVQQIAAALKQHGLTAWPDIEQLRPGLSWQDGLEEVMAGTRAAAVFVGRHNLGPWQRPEVRACLSQMVDRGLPVIPVLLPGAPVRPQIGLLLREQTWVDFRKGITEEGLDRLVWGIAGKQPSRRKAPTRTPRRARPACKDTNSTPRLPPLPQ
jgi:hypothetical protein